jgi:hypothetical protein
VPKLSTMTIELDIARKPETDVPEEVERP